MQLELERFDSQFPRKCIYGNLALPSGLQMITLEDPLVLLARPGLVARPGEVAEKIPGLTSIPTGLYRLVLTKSFRFGKILPRLLDIPGFSGILIHPGNTVEDTAGCILVGLESPRPGVLSQSRAAMALLMKELKSATGPIFIKIIPEKRST